MITLIAIWQHAEYKIKHDEDNGGIYWATFTLDMALIIMVGSVLSGC